MKLTFYRVSRSREHLLLGHDATTVLSLAARHGDDIADIAIAFSYYE